MGATVATPEAAADRREPEPRPTAESRPTRERTISTGKPAEETGSRRGGKRRRASKDNEATGHDSIFLDQADEQRHARARRGNGGRTPGAL